MTTLWRPDAELEAARKLPSWPLFHKALGQSGLHTQNERREYGEYVVPYYSLIQSKGHLYRQGIGEGFGPTVVIAMARGFVTVSQGTLLSRAAGFRARLALLDLLLS